MKIRINEAIVEKANNGDDLVGICSKEGQIIITVPSFFRIEEKISILRKDLILFLQSIRLANDKNNKENIDYKSNGSNLPIDSFLWIIRDYLENGFYFNREKIYKQGFNGKINWKKTLEYTPIFTNDNYIYDKIITTKVIASNDLINHIYKICLKKSVDTIGWLYDFNIPVEVIPLISVEEMKYRIKSELSNTFDDIKRQRFSHMLNIIEYVDGGFNSNNFDYRIKNYYYVFEKMIDKYFNGIVKNKKDYYPMGKWKLKGYDEEIEASNLMPDTICIKDNKFYIIDSKMYKYGSTHNAKDLPDTSSMQKQVTYADYISRKYKTNDIRNIFIIPYNKELASFKNDIFIEKYNDDNFAYIGEARVDWRDGNLSYEHIFTYLVDFNYLLNNYKEDCEFDIFSDSSKR